MKKLIIKMVLLIVLMFLTGCATVATITPTSTPVPSATPAPTFTSTPPPPTKTPKPTVTPDPSLARYLEGAEILLSHSSTIFFEQALSFADACPGRYIAAFPFQTSRTDRRSLVVAMVSLPRDADGRVIEGEHQLLWTWRQEGIEPFEMDRVEWIARDSEWPLMLRTLGIFGGKWVVGVTYGTCPGDDLHLVGMFSLQHPNDFALEITRFNEDAPFDFWLQDGDRFSHLRYSRWEAQQLSTLEPAPGQLLDVIWDSTSPDLNRDGVPDVLVRWDVGGEVIEKSYVEDGQLLCPLDENE